MTGEEAREGFPLPHNFHSNRSLSRNMKFMAPSNQATNCCHQDYNVDHEFSHHDYYDCTIVKIIGIVALFRSPHPVIGEAARKGFPLPYHLLEQVLLVQEHEDRSVLENGVLHHLVEQLQSLVHSDWREDEKKDKES